MPRMMRLEFPGSLVHLIARGIDGRDLFLADYDRIEFLSRFEKLVRRIHLKCITWCLMDNHYHLLLRTNENPLSKLMRPLNGGYARWFNKKYSRKGYLFQDRYKSIVCQDQQYALELIRYINLNPIRAGKVKSLSSLMHWKWCGHAFLAGKASAYGAGFQDRAEALRRFGRVQKESLAGYMSYLAEGVDDHQLDKAGLLPQTAQFEIAGSYKGWPAVIGDAEFAGKAMERHKISCMRKHRQADYGSILEGISADVCSAHGIKIEDLFERGRLDVRSNARAAFAYRAHCGELLPLGVIAAYLKMTVSPVDRLVKRGREMAAEVRG